MYGVGIFNDWVEMCIALAYAMIELKYILHSTIQWLSSNMYCVGICNDWAELCIAFEYAVIELKYV